MTCTVKLRALAQLVVILALAGVALPALSPPLQAQSPSGWWPPRLIYETADSIDAPYLAADTNGVAHLVWRESPRETDLDQDKLQTIFYANNEGGTWSQGRDIIAMSGVAGPTAAADPNGIIQLLWTGPNNTLYHSLAGVQSAGTAQGWVEPVAIATANANAHIQIAPDNNAHIVYPGTGPSGVYYIRYDAGRDAWSSPVGISLTSGANTSADYARLAIAPDGMLHVVWTEFELPQGWPPTGVYYAHSTDNGVTWSRPVELAGQNNVQANVVVDSAGRVHVAWNGIVGIGGRYHRWSDDGGLNWSATGAAVEAGLGGTEGQPQLAVDSAGTLHMLTTYGGCAHHVTWTDEVWSAPECISGQVAAGDALIEQPALTIVNGNVLHAIFWDERARLWHTSLATGAPPAAAQPSAAATAAPAGAPAVASPSPVVASSPTVDLASLPPADVSISQTPARTLLLAAGSAVVLLLLALMIKVWRSR